MTRANLLIVKKKETKKKKYQWALFGLCGYGWLVNQLWQTAVSDALAQASLEFNEKHSAFLSLALVAGIMCGASFWGLGYAYSFSSRWRLRCGSVNLQPVVDLIGRRLAFNMTLVIAAVFGLASGAAPNFAGLGVMFAFFCFGVGGNGMSLSISGRGGLSHHR
jgi:hypothetical protein